MSDSVTNVQIEDVLSSIRKLVSEEVRAQTRETVRRETRTTAQARTEPADGSGPEAGEDRLLLTPALRVQPGEQETPAPDPEEAPFTHAEESQEEADLLDLMARVRAAGNRPAEVEAPAKPPLAAAPEPSGPKNKSADLHAPASDAAIRSALFALGDTVRATMFVSDRKDADPDKTADLPSDPPLRLDARDTLAFAGRDDRVAPRPDAEEDDAVPKFLHRSGITSLGQRIAEVESVVSTSGGDWEPEADEEAEAAPDPQSRAVPWDEPEAEQTVDEPPSDAISGTVDDSDDWSVAPDPKERDFVETPASRSAHDGAPDIDIAADTTGIIADPEDMLAEGGFEDLESLSSVVEDVLVDDEPPREGADADRLSDVPDRMPDDLIETFETDADDGFDDPAEQRAPDLREDPAEDDGIATVPPVQARSVGTDSFDEADREALVADDATYIDEEMLRDLVSEIVRQELQGALGERITRNVRKLVRREIHRALTAQDL